MSAPRTPRTGARTAAGHLALLAVVNAIVWGRTLAGEFVFDDVPNIVENSWIRSPGGILHAFTSHAAGFDPGFTTSFYRPLMHVIYGLTLAIFGPRPWGFHLVNLAFHVAVTSVVYVLTREVFRRYAGGSDPGTGALVAALVFAVHPVHTEPVAWLAGITDLSCTLFGLLALFVLLRAGAGSWRAPVGAGVLLLAALLSKETGAVFLVLAAVLAWRRAREGGAAPRRALPVLVVSAAVATLYAVLRVVALGAFAPSARQHAHAFGTLVADAGALFGLYLRTLVVPYDLNVLRDVPVDRTLSDGAAVAGLLAAALVAAALWRLRRTPLPFLAGLVVVLPILPTLYVPAIESGESVFGERYLYLPVLGLAWIVAWAIAAVPAPGPRRAAYATLGVLLAAGAGMSFVHAGVWRTGLDLFGDAAAKSPRSAAAHEGLCYANLVAQRYGDAIAECRETLRLDPGRDAARVNLATALNELGVVLARSGRIDEARVSFAEAVRLAPGNAGFRANYASAGGR